jgi:hypothetical protein
MLQQNKGCSLLCGPVAQLGARFHGMEEVTGSIPVRSTTITISIISTYRRQRAASSSIEGAEGYFTQQQAEAEQFYADRMSSTYAEDERNIARQAYTSSTTTSHSVGSKVTPASPSLPKND